MKKVTKRILSVFLIALLVSALLPMGAFAEEVAEPQQVQEAAEQKAVVIEPPVEEEAEEENGIETYSAGEMQTCTFYVLYVDDSYPLGYNYSDKAKWGVEYECQYSTCGSGSYNHSMACYVIKEQVDYAKTMVDPEWEIVGWTKTASANPKIFTTYSGTTATQTSYTIYIVAKKSAPTPPTPAVEKTFTVNYMNDGATYKTDTKTGTDDSESFTVISDNLVSVGKVFKGWVDASNTLYQAGSSFDLSANTPNAVVNGDTITLELTATWEDFTPPVEDNQYTFNVKYFDEDGTTKAADDQTETKNTNNASFTVKGTNDIYEAVLANHPNMELDHWIDKDTGNVYYPGDTIRFGNSSTNGISTQATYFYLTNLTAVWKDKEGGEEPTPDPEEKVSVPGMLKTNTETGLTGDGAIGTLKPGDTVGFTLKTNVGEDMMWSENEAGDKVQKLTKNTDGKWEGEYVLTITDTMEGPMTIVGDITVTINGTDASDYVAFTTKTNTGFVLTIDCVAALNAGVFTVEDIGSAVVLVTYTAKVDDNAADKAILKNTASVNGSAESAVSGDVTNPPIEPPHTGGNGTRMFTIGGVLILAAACVLFAASRKKAKD